MTKFAIALGSNQGARLGHLRQAVDELRGLGGIEGVSGLYETEPIGGPAQDPYLNAVVILETSLSAMRLLQSLHEIEAAHNRSREIRWGPRTLDLDIITMEPGVVETPELQVPHPRAAERLFVLEPLCDMWPEARVNGQMRASEARTLLADQEVELLAPEWLEDDPRPGHYWVGAQLLLFVGVIVALTIDGSWPDRDLDGWQIAGGVMFLLGASLVVVASRALGRALSPMPDPVAGAELIESGPYALARHPIYGALCVGVLGASFLFSSVVTFILGIGLVVFFWAKSGYEERRLRIAYPSYSAYRRRVRPRLFPYLI